MLRRPCSCWFGVRWTPWAIIHLYQSFTYHAYQLSPLGVVGSVGGPITDGSLWDRDRLRVRVRLGLGCTGRGEAWGSRELCACAGHQMSCYVMFNLILTVYISGGGVEEGGAKASRGRTNACEGPRGACLMDWAVESRNGTPDHSCTLKRTPRVSAHSRSGG